MSIITTMRVLSGARCGKILGSLSKHDGDSNHNGKRAIGLDKPNNNFARASRFLAHFFAVTTAPQPGNCLICIVKAATFFFFS